MFIQTEATPNPSTLKFLPGRVVLQEGTYDFRSRAEAGVSPLAEKLFDVPGVVAVFFGHDFVTVTKDDTDWQHMKPAILGVVMEQFMSGQPVMSAGQSEDIEEGEFFEAGDQQTVTPSRNFWKPVSVRRLPRMAATSPSRDSRKAWFTCPCAVPAPAVHPPRPPFSTAFRTCCAISCRKWKKSVRSER